MKLALSLIAVVVAIVLVDRLMLAAERRGWIYWRKKKASPGTAASAMLELQSLIEPGRTHVVQARRAEETESDEQGDDVDSRGCLSGEAKAHGTSAGREPS